VRVQEVRWEKGGIERAEDCTFFCGQGNGDHQSGTGFFVHKRILSAVSRVEFISDRMCKPHVRMNDDVKDSLYEELGRVFDQFSKYDMNILLADFNANVGRENIFKPRIGNESLHEISKDNGFGVVNFVTSKNLVARSTMFPHPNIHTHTWTSPEGNAHNQIDHILIDRRQHSSALDVRSFKGADCDTDRYLVAAKVRERDWQ
jgi:hypothetical protein